MEDSYRMDEQVAERVDWGRLLDDYLELYIDQKEADIERQDLESYPDNPPTSENEFLLAKNLAEQEIGELLEDQPRATYSD